MPSSGRVCASRSSTWTAGASTRCSSSGNRHPASGIRGKIVPRGRSCRASRSTRLMGAPPAQPALFDVGCDHLLDGALADRAEVIGASEHDAVLLRPVVAARFVPRALERADLARASRLAKLLVVSAPFLGE